MYIDHLRDNGGQLKNIFFNSNRDDDVFKLREWVVMRTVPLSIIEDTLTRSIINITAVFSKSFPKSILSIITLVEDAIKKEFPSKFDVIVDKCFDSNMHLVVLRIHAQSRVQ